MKLDFKGTEKPCAMNMRTIFSAWLSYNDIHIFPSDMTFHYNGAYDFWDISIFKWCKNKGGVGTKEYRADKWKDDLQNIKELLGDQIGHSSSTFKWADNEEDYDHKQIPGVRIWIYRHD